MLNSMASLQNLVSSLSGLNDRQTQITNEMSSGMRISALSDDPSAAGQAITMADTLGTDEAFLSTATSAGNRMQAADTALASVVTQLTSAISTATGALGGTWDSTSRTIAAQTLSAVRDSIVSLANSNYGGAYLFSGTSSAAPFTEDANGNVTYSGNSDTSSVTLASGGGTVPTSLPGSSVFSAAGASVFNALNNIITALKSSDAPADPTALLSNLRSSLDQVTSQRSSLNSAQNRLSGEGDYITAQKTNLQAQQTVLLADDPAALATELSAVTTQRSALLSTMAIVQKGTLFDYL